MSPSLRWWSPWWWPLVHLCSFRCRLLDGSHYTRNQLIAQIGILRHHENRWKHWRSSACRNHDTTPRNHTMRSATSRPRHHHRHETPQTQPGRHDMTTTHRRTRHHGHTHDGHARPCTTATATARPRSCTATSHMQLRKQRNAPARYHTTRNTSTEQTFERTDVR